MNSFPIAPKQSNNFLVWRWCDKPILDKAFWLFLILQDPAQEPGSEKLPAVNVKFQQVFFLM
jgi:hypothetical protein